MKQLKAIVGPTQAFINTLISAAVFYLNKDQGKSTLLPSNIKSSLMSSWASQGATFCTKYGLNSKAFTKMVDLVGKLGPDDEADDLDDACGDMVSTIKSHWARIQKDASLSSEHLQMLKDCTSWLNSGSSSALTRIRKNMPQVGVATELVQEFRQDTESQEPYLKKLIPLVKRLTGTEGTKIPLEVLQEVRQKAPEKLYKQYLELRRICNSIYKTELVNLVRDGGGEPIDVAKARKYFKSKNIQHLIPEGFVGKIGEDGALFTTEGKKIDGVPQHPVKMNPDYDPKNDNGNVFKVLLPTTDSKGNQNVQHFYTVTYRKKKTNAKFEVVKVLIDRIPQLRAKWLKDMRSTNNDVRIPATMVELSYLTCVRVGTPGNMTKGVRTDGLTTFTVGHVKKMGTSRVLDFIAKDGVPMRNKIDPATTENKLIIKLLDELAEGKSRKDDLFTKDGKRYSATLVRQYWKRLTGMDIGLHKIRTLRGTKLAIEVLEKAKNDTLKKKTINQSVVNKAFQDALKNVGSLLGHVRGVGTNQKVTWATAANAYVDPAVQQEFFDAFAPHGVRLPAFLAKKQREV